MSTFEPFSDTQMLDLIRGSKIKSCVLDPLPASLMRKCYTTTLVSILKRIINQSLAAGEMSWVKNCHALTSVAESKCWFRELQSCIQTQVCIKINYWLKRPYLTSWVTTWLTTIFMWLCNPHTKLFKGLRPHYLGFNDILLALEKGENVLLTLLDLSAAFDTANHSLLLSRLHQQYGLCGTVLISGLSLTFATDNESYSSKCVLSVGVPQGSVLHGTCVIPRAIMGQGGNLRALARICEFHSSYF